MQDHQHPDDYGVDVYVHSQVADEPVESRHELVKVAVVGVEYAPEQQTDQDGHEG